MPVTGCVRPAGRLGPVWTTRQEAAGTSGRDAAGSRGALVAAVAALLLLAGLLAAAMAVGRPNDARWVLLGLLGAMWLVFAAAAGLLLRVPVRAAVPLLLGGGVLLQLVALGAAPRSTDDYLRYAWDGTVQASGTDPYRYVPTDPALAGLRPDWLFPPGCRSPEPACTAINHPSVRTIYPPVAQAWFLVVHALSPAGSEHRPWQLTAAALAVLTAAAIVVVLRRSGGDPRRAVFWAWCPAVAVEAGNAAHVDVLGVLLTVAGLGLVAAGRAWRGGALLGAAVGVKLLPALVFPAVLRRRGAVVTLAAAGVLALSYLPHVLAVGPEVLGYLPGYLTEEGYDGTGRFPVLRLLLPYRVSPYVAVLVLLAAAVLVVLRTEQDRPWDGAVVMTGVAFLVSGPTYPWYALLLVGLVALSGRWEWLPVAMAGYPVYFVGALHLPPEATKTVSYTAAAVLLAVLLAARLARRGTVSPPPAAR